MKFTRTITEKVDVEWVEIVLPLRNGRGEEYPADFPGRRGDTITLLINIRGGTIKGWGEERPGFDLALKVCDEGCYRLLDKVLNEIASIENDYVPNELIPGSYGDYVKLEIGAGGKIKNWPTSIDLSEFPGFGDDED